MASGEVATVELEVGRAAAGLRRNHQRPDLRCHRTRRLSVTYPFPVKDLVILDDALKYGSRAAKARFAVYLGDLGADTAATARDVLAEIPTPNNAVLLAVSPNQRAIEVVYGGRRPGPRDRGVRAARCLGGRRVVQRGQPDGRPDQRRPGYSAPAFPRPEVLQVAPHGSRHSASGSGARRAVSGAATW